MPIHKSIRFRPITSIIGVLFLLLSITGLSADTPRTTESSSSPLYSKYSPVADGDAGDVLGSFVVRVPKWDVWAGGRRVLRRTRDELGALPLRGWLTDHVMRNESIGERGRQRAEHFVWDLARSAVDEGVLAATDELRRRSFVRTTNVDLDLGLGDRFAHLGVDVLGACTNQMTRRWCGSCAVMRGKRVARAATSVSSIGGRRVRNGWRV